MESFKAINIRNLFYVDKEMEKDASFWLLYQTDRKSKCRIRLFSIGQRIQIEHVLPETVCYILYKEGKCYKKESLADQIEGNRLNVEQIILKEGFGINVPEEVLENKWDYLVPRFLRKEEIYEIIVDEFNGFCVFHPDTYMSKCVDVCYRPNTKRLYKAFLDTIYCQIDLEKVDFDYKQYFVQALEDEQKFLLEEECWKLFDFLEECTKMYYLSGNAQWFNNATGELVTKDVCVLKKGRGICQAVFYEDKKVNLDEELGAIYTTRQDNTTLDKTIQAMIQEMTMQGKIRLEEIQEMAMQDKIRLEEIQEMTMQDKIEEIRNRNERRREIRREIAQAIIQEMKVQGGEIEKIKKHIIAMMRKEWKMGWEADDMIQEIIEQKIRQLLYKWWIEGSMIQTVAKARFIGALRLQEI